jgi:2-polyprenyl-3-methyl-5-hydroxy-6-metoxy-1,4-benzoquinol methylase
MKRDNNAVWREALLLPGETDPVESGVRELAAYFGISRAEAHRRCETALADSKCEWEAAPRDTPEQIKDFYRQTQSYLFEHIWWHATDAEANAPNVAAMDYARTRRAKHYLDFGSGVGSNAILFAQHGFQVTLADISRPMLNFARWRMERRGLTADYIDLNEQALPVDQYDFITAMDVCEHLDDPAQELQRLSRALKIGGTMVFNYRAGIDEERPMHILATAAPVLRALRRSGLRNVGTSAQELRKLNLCVVERVSSKPWEDRWLGLYDQVRYSRVFMPGEMQASGAEATNHAVCHPQQIYFEEIEQTLQPQMRWLDIGCGRQLVPWWLKNGGELEAQLSARAGYLVGVDPDFAALRDNRSCRARVQTDTITLPFAEASFDLVTSNMVFEHVTQPSAVLAEIRRVLRPGGKFMALTPNWLDIVTVTARLVPNSLHPAIVSRVELREGQDVYPTYFRFNRPRTVATLLRQAGFQRWRVRQLDHPDVYSHVPLIARIETMWHQLARRWPALRGVLLIEAE